jgi:3-dehydroquinate synthase
MIKITIESTKKPYDVLIENGLLDHLENHLDPAVFYVIVADDHIPDDYVAKVSRAVPEHLVIRFPEGEQSKSLAEFSRITEILIRQNVRKDACIIALGGGVTGDLAGFVASVYLRGIPFIQIPTTLLAQIDSSVGGKVAIDTATAKNVIGSFWTPLKVLIDPLTLSTLSVRHKNNGMAEMIKYGMIADKDFFFRMKNEDVFQNLESFIARSVQIKKRFVESDEFDTGIRQALNFGHTIGHALESYYQYHKYFHGEAIAIGMVRILSSDAIRNELIAVLKKYNLPTEDPIGMDDLKIFINRDKKNRKDLLKIVDVEEIGKAIIVRSQYQI